MHATKLKAPLATALKSAKHSPQQQAYLTKEQAVDVLKCSSL